MDNAMLKCSVIDERQSLCCTVKQFNAALERSIIHIGAYC